MARRNSSGITDLLSDIADDIKDFIDDEVVDRGKDTERELRKAGRNWTDSDDSISSRATSSRNDDVAELRAAIAALSEKIDSLSKK